MKAISMPKEKSDNKSPYQSDGFPFKEGPPHLGIFYGPKQRLYAEQAQNTG